MTQNAQDESAVSEVAVAYKPEGWKRQFEEGRRYTYADYCTWDDYDEQGRQIRYELIDGVPYAMSAPAWKHQEIVVELVKQFANYLEGKTCKVYVAPFDVRLNADTTDDTSLQPDVLIICDRSKISGTGCKGAPDMTIEVLSPSTVQRDMLIKLKQYEKYGVREYWTVDIENSIVHVHELKDGQYIIKQYKLTDSIPVGIFEDCIITLPEIDGEG